MPDLRVKGRAMHGANLSEVIVLRCVVCKKFVAVRLDPDDWQRHRNGLFVQDAFTNENGVPYLSPAERELFITAVCGSCWSLLCPDPIIQPINYN
jgi:hypothetical protein